MKKKGKKTSYFDQVPIRPSYLEVRPRLFQDAFVQSISGAKFDDTEIHVVSARTRSGTAHKPRILHARSAFLEAASLKFEDEIYRTCTVPKNSSTHRTCSIVDYGYDEDSDLEDCEEDPPAPSFRSTCKQLQAVGVVTETGTDPLKQTEDEAKILPESYAEITFLDDCDSESGLSDLIKEAREQVLDAPTCMYEDEPATAVCDPLCALNFETSSPALCNGPRSPEAEDPVPKVTLEDLSMATRPQEELTGVSPIPTDVLTAVSEFEIKETELTADDHERVLFIGNCAHKTWQVLLLYLYNDYQNFAPLRSASPDLSIPTDDRPRCSPKSMYRLADKLDLVDLKKSSLEAIQRGLSGDNIVKELFSDFTWRYPEVLQMETDVFSRHCGEPTVQVAMSKTFRDIAGGQLPRSSIVLDSLFKKFASMTSAWGIE